MSDEKKEEILGKEKELETKELETKELETVAGGEYNPWGACYCVYGGGGKSRDSE